MDFGYNEARGILRTVNGNLVPSYFSALSENETFAISEAEALQEYFSNTEFRTVVNSGLYLYVPESGCFCLNSRKFLYFDHEGHPHLRKYAREHMAQCCLVFRAERGNVLRRFINGALQKGSTVRRGRRNIRYVNEKGGSPATEAGLLLRKQIEAQMQEAARYQKSFNDMTVELMQRRNVTVGMLADDTGLSEDTIKNFRNRSNIIFLIQEIVAVCIALHLPPAISMEYIRVSPSKFQTMIEMKIYASQCASCPHKDQCRPKIYKRAAVHMISKGMIVRTNKQKTMQTDEYKKYGRIRNGVETVPSMLRRFCDVDKMPVRGLLRMKQRLGFMVGAVNFRKFKRQHQRVKSAQLMVSAANA